MSNKKQIRVSFKTDKTTAKEAKAIFAALGMDLQTGLNVYLRQVIVSEGLPFTPSTVANDPLPMDVVDEVAPDSQTAASNPSNETAP